MKEQEKTEREWDERLRADKEKLTKKQRSKN